MSKSRTTADSTEQTGKLTEGPNRSPRIDLGDASLILYLAGEQLDDPDPVRVSKWICRLRAEGVIR